MSLGFAPELGQQTMTEELLALLQEILRQWTDPLPQLAYISDAGDQEEAFYTKRLCRMRHPVTKTRLRWQRVVDYYHAASRLTTIAESLNLDEASATAWARCMSPGAETRTERRPPDPALGRGVGISVRNEEQNPGCRIRNGLLVPAATQRLDAVSRVP